MANATGLFLEQSQKLILSPQMIQSIEMIQLTLPELLDYVNNELIENPLLEIPEDSRKQQEGDSEGTESKPVQEKETQWLDQIFEQVLHGEKDNWTGPLQRTEETAGTEGRWLDNSNLQEYLLEQLRFTDHRGETAGVDYRSAEYIIGNLDSNGYFTLSLEEVAQALGIGLEAAARGLQLVQKLDPPGVGARDLKECLALQLPLLPECPPKMKALLDHLEDLAAGHLKKIAQALNVTPDQVLAMKGLLRMLDPKPGSGYDHGSETKYIIPDATIRKIGDQYVVLVNEGDLPKIAINEAYKKVLSEQEDPEIRKYLRDKLQSALQLMKSIEHRRGTIHDVLESVAKRQNAFLNEGPAALVPLTMKEVAEELEIHESTVSRVAANKYVQTPRGTFSIKRFFTGSVGGGKDLSPQRIKDEIRKLILEEKPSKPYSDQALADHFKSQNIDIARRTVAKYREELRIPTSSLRKQSQTKKP